MTRRHLSHLLPRFDQWPVQEYAEGPPSSRRVGLPGSACAVYQRSSRSPASRSAGSLGWRSGSVGSSSNIVASYRHPPPWQALRRTSSGARPATSRRSPRRTGYAGTSTRTRASTGSRSRCQVHPRRRRPRHPSPRRSAPSPPGRERSPRSLAPYVASSRISSPKPVRREASSALSHLQGWPGSPDHS